LQFLLQSGAEPARPAPHRPRRLRCLPHRRTP
jgi:hypothetical protein